jgi:HSP20 family protein
MNAIRFYHPGVEKSLVHDLFRSFVTHDSLENSNCGCAPANIREEENSFRIELYVPGFSKEEVKINVQKNILTIQSVKSENPEQKSNYLSREFGTRNFERSFSLPKNVNVEEISAAFHNGILEITLPKKEEVVEKAPVEIEIQ